MPKSRSVHFLDSSSSDHERIDIDSAEFSTSDSESKSGHDSPEIRKPHSKASNTLGKVGKSDRNRARLPVKSTYDHAPSESDSESDNYRNIRTAQKKSKASMKSSSQPQTTRRSGQSHENMSNDNSETRLAKLLHGTQLKLDHALSENKDLRKKCAELNVQLSNLTKSGVPVKAGQNDTEEKRQKKPSLDIDDRIARCARKFGVMNELFVDGNSFMVQHPGCKAYTEDRYANSVSAANGVIAELFREVPEDLHERMMKHSSFRNTFLEKLNGGRRNIVHDLRNDIAPVIFKRSKEDFQPGAGADRASFPEFVKAVYQPKKKKFSKYAPILYLDRDTSRNDNLFRTKELALMLRGILFGPSSILDTTAPPSSKSKGKKWGVQRTTPGAIALVSTLAVFIHSKDKHLEAVGAESNIPYSQIFDAYKCILIRNSIQKDPVTADLLEFYDGIVFTSGKGKKKADVQESEEEDESSGVEGAIRSMKSLALQAKEMDNCNSDQNMVDKEPDFDSEDLELPLEQPEQPAEHHSTPNEPGSDLSDIESDESDPNAMIQQPKSRTPTDQQAKMKPNKRPAHNEVEAVHSDEELMHDKGLMHNEGSAMDDVPVSQPFRRSQRQKNAGNAQQGSSLPGPSTATNIPKGRNAGGIGKGKRDGRGGGGMKEKK